MFIKDDIVIFEENGYHHIVKLTEDQKHPLYIKVIRISCTFPNAHENIEEHELSGANHFIPYEKSKHFLNNEFNLQLEEILK